MSSSVTPGPTGMGPENDRVLSPFTVERNDGNRSWGDFRSPQQEDCFRISFWNCGGIPQSTGDLKNRVIRQWIQEYQLDVIGLSECNLYWPAVPAAQQLRERTFGWFQTLHTSVGYLSDWPAATPHQVGGTSVWSINRGAHKVNKQGSDQFKLGRWCWTTYRGVNGRVVRIISGYRCVLNKDGALSVWNQQKTVLEKHDIDTDPREQFTKDLVQELFKWIEDGDLIVLGLDVNEAVSSSDFEAQMQHVGLVNIISERHGTTPPTYIRGNTTIDAIFVSPILQGSFCGFLPILGDHRPSWIDIPFSILFGSKISYQPRARRLQLQDPRVVQRYTVFLQTFIRDHDLLSRVTNLQVLVRQGSSSLSAIQQEYDAIDTLRQQGMQLAEQQCRKISAGAVPFTPEYNRLARMVLCWRLIVRIKSGYSVDSRYLGRIMKFLALPRDTVRSTTLDSAQSQLRHAYNLLNVYTKTAVENRKKWLHEVAEARSLISGLSAEQEAEAMTSRETQRRDARIIRAATKGVFQAGLSMIRTVRNEMEIDLHDKDEIEHELCLQLATRFHQACHTPFASAPLLNLVGPLGNLEGAQSILDGTFICPPGVDAWTIKLLPHLKYIPSAAQIRQDFPITLTDEMHSEGWKKMKEFTSAGYSTLSFAQFKAASLVDDLTSLDSAMAEIPYQSGISPARWQHGVDVMLPKQLGNYSVDKLRAILLYEADFNQNNKRFGRDLMKLAEKHNGLAMEQFGSRKYRSAIDQSLNKALTFDLWRQFRSSGALCSNDAKSCYDRILHNFASLALQRLGAPLAPIISMFSTIQRLKHHIRTVHGDSITSFSGENWEIPIHGVGQGNGAGPQIWAAVSTPLLNLLRAEDCGSYLQASISREALHFVGYAFVDDTDLVASHWQSQTADQIFESLQLSMDAWQGALNASGGAIVPEKTHWYMIHFTWRNGLPFYQPASRSPGPLYVRDSMGIRRRLELKEPSVASKTLGVFLAPDGNMISQAASMRVKALEWSDRLRSGSLSCTLSSQALLTTIMKTLEYPLPVTTLTEVQCQYIMSPLLQACLPRLGVMKTFPHAIAHAAFPQLGLAIPNLFWLQGFYHIDRLLRYHRSSHLTGRLLRQSLEALRLELGCDGSLFRIPFSIFGGLATPSWMKHTWEFLSDHNLSLDIHVPELRLFRENDSLLMPLLASAGFRELDLRNINRCRMFLQVTTLSDITTGCGKFITYSAWNGVFDDTLVSPYLWPCQHQPTNEQWTSWKTAMASLCFSGKQLRNPLGKWFESHGRAYFYDVPTERIYLRQDDSIWYFRRMNQGRPSRQSVNRFGGRIRCTEFPLTAVPASVERRHRGFNRV